MFSDNGKRVRLGKGEDASPHLEPLWEEKRLLGEEYAETRILRLLAAKPAKLTDLTQTEKILSDLKRFRSLVRDSSEYGRDYDVKRGCSYDYDRQAAWSGKDAYGIVYYLITSSKIAKIDLLIEDLAERVNQLRAEERQKAEALQRSNEASRQFAQAGQDEKLAGALWHALEAMSATVGFVYFKRWTMPDDSRWFKIGITSDPDRREREQNVLPVAAESIICVDVGSMDRARAIEAVIHQVLEEQRITNANNRELFHLSDQQASAVKAILERLA